jgi:trehalose 6-phosphate phosphatase
MPGCETLTIAPILVRAEISLFLDFDGTLVTLADRPDVLVVPANVALTLADLSARLDGRIALVSGRSVAQLDALLGPAAGMIAVIGSHGAEIRLAGQTLSLADRPEALRTAQRAFEETFSDHPDVLVEVKSLGVAIHYRRTPGVEPFANNLAERFAAENGLAVQKGKMMVEVRVGGRDKGSGIATLMRMVPFSGHRPVFIGDDLTDEAGFESCLAMGGVGILVGPARRTAASYRLDDVAGVHAWLDML